MVMNEVRNLPKVVNCASQVQRAGERAAELTKQLLAFSRQQIRQPVIIQLNDVMANMEKLLRPVIGEDIDFSVHLEPTLASVHVDPSHLDQVIMNLVVNARDAMPGGGRLTVETSNVNLDEEYAQRHADIVPGRYVQMAISDTGHGMNGQTQKHMFEPFFTTKEMGKGTGLGLSIVYGIVKQNGGDISVYSQEGQGTTFKIHLPAATGDSVNVSSENGSSEPSRKGTEVILVVEDEPEVRALIQTMLADHGYSVLKTETVHDAIQICREYGRPIHLLLTDVVMPGLAGPDLADQLVQIHPEMRIFICPATLTRRLFVTEY
jgi:two-component sensor histidine kinase